MSDIEDTNKSIEEKKDKIKSWFGDNYNKALFFLMTFTIIVRLYYFSLTATQPTWWDEGDYLAIGKEFAIPAPETPEWWGHFTDIRPLLMPFAWSIFIRLGLGEAIMRFFTEVEPSILLVWFSYLLAKSLFNKKVGLIAGYITSVYWVILFYGNRFMTDIPALMFAVVSAYFFWEWYVQRGKKSGLYLSVLFGVLGFHTRFPTALIVASIILFLILTSKFKFLIKKETWSAGAVGLATLLPYFIYNKIAKDSWFPAATFYGSQSSAVYYNPAWNLFGFIPEFIGSFLTFFLFVGLAYALFELIASGNLLWKQEKSLGHRHLFLFIWLALHIWYYVFSIKTGNDRWMLVWMPPIFIYVGLGLVKIGDFLNKYAKNVGTIAIFLILIVAGYQQLSHADELVKVKLESYKEVKDTGLWLKENTPENSKIMAASIVQNTYYSHRRSYDFYIGTELIQKTKRVDPQGRMIDETYITLRNETELECKIDKIKPDYLVLHPWEPEFTPQFMYDYPQRHQELFMPVKVFERDGQTTAIIYQFLSHPVINESIVNCTDVYERPSNLTGIHLRETAPERFIIPS